MTEEARVVVVGVEESDMDAGMAEELGEHEHALDASL